MHDERYVAGVDYDEDELEDDTEEWQEGECDMCFGAALPQDLEPGEAGGIVPVCACAIGQGAPADECQCGPEEE
ncbi:hypothetical protein [Streptomyces sp. NPDC004008]